MRPLAWALWHGLRHRRLTIARPYDAPIGWTARCRCGDRSR